VEHAHTETQVSYAAIINEIVIEVIIRVLQISVCDCMKCAIVMLVGFVKMWVKHREYGSKGDSAWRFTLLRLP
jgi:hypothetical protein